MTTALVIAPHPDDAELAMGGTIARMINAGWDIIVADLTNGEPTPFGSTEVRLKESKTADKILGITKRIRLDMPNRCLRATLLNRKKIAEVIRLNKPDLIFAPVTPDWHPDHKAASQLIDEARFEAKFQKTKMQGTPHWTARLFFYYSPHRTEYRGASFIVDITDFWEKKLAAVRAYKSQLKNAPLSNPHCLTEKIEIAARYFGQCINVKYAEPFLNCEPMAVKKIELLGDL